MNKYCETYIKISKDALKHNARFFKDRSKKKLIAVIKSNAYGHGLIDVGHILEDEADMFAVASLDSAISLRKADIKLPILVLNPVNCEYVNDALENDIMLSVNSLQELKNIRKNIKMGDELLNIHLKVDTGMNRMGTKTVDECRDIIDFAKDNNINVAGIYTHFHSADNTIHSKKQQDQFTNIYNALNYQFRYVHLCSTGATLNGWDPDYSTHVRIGLGLYGICDSKDVLPVLSMYSKIMIKKELKREETVGYGARFTASENTWIGVLPCGYSDGIIRSNVGRKVYIDGHHCEIIGSVCMNSLMIKLPFKDIGEEVELIGPHVSAIDIAKHLGTISYEVTTILPPHLKRIIV